jgi:hypothetical protein
VGLDLHSQPRVDLPEPASKTEFTPFERMEIRNATKTPRRAGPGDCVIVGYGGPTDNRVGLGAAGRCLIQD